VEESASEEVEDAKEEAGAKLPDLLREPEGPMDGANPTQGGPPPQVVNFHPKHPLTIGANKSVLSKRGRLRQGEEVRDTDFDPETLEHLLKIKCVVRGK
jgi:hypothetical protein